MVSSKVPSLAPAAHKLLPATQTHKEGSCRPYSPPHSWTPSISTLQFCDMVSKLGSQIYYTIVSNIKSSASPQVPWGTHQGQTRNFLWHELTFIK